MKTEKHLQFGKPQGTRDMTKNKEPKREQVKWYRKGKTNEG